MTHRDFQNSVDFGSVDYRMIRTIFSIGTIRQFVVLEVEVKLNLPIESVGRALKIINR